MLLAITLHLKKTAKSAALQPFLVQIVHAVLGACDNFRDNVTILRG